MINKLSSKGIQKTYIGGKFLPHHIINDRRYVSVFINGKGLTPHGAGMKGEIPNPSGAGLTPHGVSGDGKVGDWFKKAVRDTGRFLTSKPVRQISRTLRGVATPLIKQMLPSLIDQAVQASAFIPAVGPAVSMVGQVAKDPLKKGLIAGIDYGNVQAEKAGYGAQYQGYNLNKRQIDHLGAKDVALDKHSVDILDGILGKRGAGIMRM